MFRRSWAGQTVGDLFELIVATMPEGQPGSLRPEEYGDIVAFILQSNDYPPGSEDLPTDPLQLENIRIVEAPK